MERTYNKKGRLFVIEGIDGSGKTTQYNLLLTLLREKGIAHAGTSFPNYESPSGRLVKSYLDGAFGSDPGDVNAYAAASFFAVDRYASFKTDLWGGVYRGGGLVLSSRYTTSNAVHQASKLPEGARESFFEWLSVYEYGLLGLPRPDAVFYLDVPLETALSHIQKRAQSGGAAPDIHESSKKYLTDCHAAGSMAADYYGWIKIPVMRGGAMKSPEEISRLLCEKISEYITEVNL